MRSVSSWGPEHVHRPSGTLFLFKVHKVVVLKRVSVLEKDPEREHLLLKKKHQRGVWELSCCPFRAPGSSADVLATALHGQFGPWRPCVPVFLTSTSSVLPEVRWIGRAEAGQALGAPEASRAAGRQDHAQRRLYREVLCVQRNQCDPVWSFPRVKGVSGQCPGLLGPARVTGWQRRLAVEALV